jgi:hypothetical protein
MDGRDVVCTLAVLAGENAETGFSTNEDVARTMLHIIEFAEGWASDDSCNIMYDQSG